MLRSPILRRRKPRFLSKQDELADVVAIVLREEANALERRCSMYGGLERGVGRVVLAEKVPRGRGARNGGPERDGGQEHPSTHSTSGWRPTRKRVTFAPSVSKTRASESVPGAWDGTTR